MNLVQNFVDSFNSQPTRYPTASILSSNRGRWALYLFLLAVVLLLVGLASLVWPRVVVHVTPKLELVKVTVPLKVDLDIKEPIFQNSVLPGKVIESDAQVLPEQLAAFYVGDLPKSRRLLVEKKLVDQLVNLSLAQAAGEERIQSAGSQTTTWGNLVPARSGRSFAWTLVAQAQVYRQFPTLLWQQRLAGLSVAEAVSWLKAQVGVEAVSIYFYPNFLANISQKMPNNPSSLTFSLDIN